MWNQFVGTETEHFYPVKEAFCMYDSSVERKFCISIFHYLQEINVWIESGTRIGLL